MSAETEAEQQYSLRVLGMSCAACQSHVTRALERVPGVRAARVNLLLHRAEVDATGVAEPQLIAAVRSAGYDAVDAGQALPADASGPAEHAGSTAGQDAVSSGSLGVRALMLLVAGAAAMWLSMPLATAEAGPSRALLHGFDRAMMAMTPVWLTAVPATGLRFALLGLAVAAMVCAAREVYAAAWRAARHRATNMNTLVALGTVAAFGASLPGTLAPRWAAVSGWGDAVYFEAVVLILAFLLAGRWLEARARGRATTDLRRFAALDAVTDARVLDLSSEAAAGGPEAELLAASATVLPGDALAAGDLLRILPGDRLPADGVVVAGRSAVDESMLTGEPVAVTRAAGERVSAGTVNVDGVLIVRATAVGIDATLAQMRRLLERAQTSRAPLEGLADRVSRVFVPAVLWLAVVTFLVWWWAGPASHALSMAVAVLVVACPCAMGLAVPAAVSVALGSAARAGVLIKGGEALERLAGVQKVAFDKTGTLTVGRPAIVRWRRTASAQVDDGTLLRWVAELERGSTHPLAGAVVAFAEERLSGHPGGVAVEDARTLPGVGVEGMIGPCLVMVGNREVLPATDDAWAGPEADSPEGNDKQKGKSHATPVFVVVDGRLEAALWAADEVRPEAAKTVSLLHRMGLRTAMLTGDVQGTAELVARTTGVQETHAALKPAEKLAQLQRWQATGEHVAMVGDGLNDAAALAQADAGFAMAGGTDLAREAGHVLLMRNDLRLVPWTIRHGRRAARIMRGNLIWALGYNVVGIPLAAGVFLPRWGVALSPAFASAAMAFSSIAVLLNSLRLARGGYVEA